MNWFRRRLPINETIGVQFGADGIAIAHIKRRANQQPLLTYADYIPLESGLNAMEVVRIRLAKLGLQKVPCNLVMSQGQYQMLLGEAPKVPAEELAEALRWRLKDVIQFPIADAILDAFLLPEDSARGVNPMAYAIVAQRSIVSQLVAQSKAAQLVLQVIDIPELALRNLAQACCDTRRGIALVQLGQGGGNLQIIRDGSVYLTRQFSLAYTGALREELPSEALVLELQRSLDYFERQMRQSPPSHIYVCGENITEDKLTPTLRSSLAVHMELLSIAAGVQLGPEVPEHRLSLCLPALGAALRQESVGVN